MELKKAFKLFNYYNPDKDIFGDRKESCAVIRKVIEDILKTPTNKSSLKFPKWEEVEQAVCPFNGVHSSQLIHAGAKECYDYLKRKLHT